MANLKFTFAASDDPPVITVTREFAAARQLVWDCHTQSALLDRWFAPKPLTTETRHMDFRAGGHWHYAMVTPEGERYWNRLDYRTVDAIDGYTARDAFCDAAGVPNPAMPGSDWTVTFEDEGRHTVVTTVVRYASPEGLQAALAMGLQDGMASTLDRLDELLPQLQA